MSLRTLLSAQRLHDRLGVRYTDFVTAFPPGINAAATFDRRLMRLRGEAMGKEFRGKGVNVALGPAMNMARAPEGQLRTLPLAIVATLLKQRPSAP